MKTAVNEHRSKRSPIALFCFETNLRLGWSCHSYHSCHSCHSCRTVIKMKASQWSETDADEKLRLTEKRFWRSYQTDRGSPVTSNAAFGKIWCLIRIITRKHRRRDVTRDTSVSSLYCVLCHPISRNVVAASRANWETQKQMFTHSTKISSVPVCSFQQI